MNGRSLLILLVVSALALMSAACGITGQFAEPEGPAGSVETKEIQIPVPAEGPVDLGITFGPGKLAIRGGAQAGLVTGTARYNRASFEPAIQASEGRVSLMSGKSRIAGIRAVTGYLINDWTLQLGDAPVNLAMRAVGAEGDIDLGGIPVQSLEFTGSASDVEWRFSKPNPVQMDTFSFDTIATDVVLSGLSNANFERMAFSSDIGDFTLDFSGELQRDAVVDFETGASEVDMIIPRGMRAIVTVDGELAEVEASRGWEKSGSVYTLDGSGPLLEIRVKLTVGSLNLVSQ